MEMLNELQFIKDIFWECSNDFQYMGLGLGAVIYLYCILGKNSWIKRLVCFTMLFFFLFSFPLFIIISRRVLGDEGVFQLLWILPFVFLIPYASIVFGSRLRRSREKALWGIICVVLVLLAGDGIGERQFQELQKMDNIYHVTDEELQICEIVGVAGEEALVLGADEEVIQAIRRVNRYTKVIYGTNINEGDYNDEVLQLYAYMENSVISIEDVLESAQNLGVNHFVWNKWDNYSGPIGDVLEKDLQLIGETKNYWIFRTKNL